jgi:hypothetical protein
VSLEKLKSHVAWAVLRILMGPRSELLHITSTMIWYILKPREFNPGEV